MGKSKTSDRKMRLLLGNMGVDNIDEILAGGDNALQQFGQSMNKAIGVGKRAASVLQGMQGRNPLKELASIGIDPKSFSRKYETLAEFGNATPAFVCCVSTADQRLTLYDGSTIDLKVGDELSMTVSQYADHVNKRPTIALTEKRFADIYRPYRGDDLNGKTLFVWRSGGIGDLLFIRPILMAFKEKYDVEIIFATREKYHSMVEQWNDCVDELTTVPFFPRETLERADYHITYEGLIERCDAAEELDVHDLFARHSYISVTDYNRPMKCVCKNVVFDLLPPEYAVLQLGASSPIRTPFFGAMVEVADYVTENATLVISGSPRESRTIDDFISCCKNKDKIINFARYTGSIVDAVRLVDGANVVIAPDSSHVHMAATQGVPCVGIYGPFDWRSRATHYDKFKAVEPDESNVCEHGGRHCFLHSHLPCAYGTKCWNNLDPKKIINAISELIQW